MGRHWHLTRHCKAEHSCAKHYFIDGTDSGKIKQETILTASLYLLPLESQGATAKIKCTKEIKEG